MAVAEQMEHLGDTRAMADHDHDLIHELSKRVDGVWRYDQYIANAEGKPEVQKFWKKLKQEDQENVARLKELVSQELKKGCF